MLLAWMTFSGGDASFGPRFLRMAANSASLSAVTAALAVAIALVLAYGARISRSRLAAGVNRAVGLGYAIPGAVIAIGVLIPLARLDQVIGDVAALFGMSTGLVVSGTLAALVYAYLIRFLAIALQTVEAGLARVTPNMEDAARSLGMGAGATLARVHAPMIGSSLVTAGLLVFVDVMKELPATLVLRPFNFDTLATRTYTLAHDERLAEAALPSLAIVAVGVLPLLILARAVRRGIAAGRHVPPPNPAQIAALAPAALR
jgi:iron(III) transport system permease protein